MFTESPMDKSTVLVDALLKITDTKAKYKAYWWAAIMFTAPELDALLKAGEAYLAMDNHFPPNSPTLAEAPSSKEGE